MEIFNWNINFKDFGKVNVKIKVSPETCEKMISKISQSSLNWMGEQPKNFGTLKYNGENYRKRIPFDDKQTFLLFKLDVLYSNWYWVISS